MWPTLHVLLHVLDCAEPAGRTRYMSVTEASPKAVRHSVHTSRHCSMSAWLSCWQIVRTMEMGSLPRPPAAPCRRSM